MLTDKLRPFYDAINAAIAEVGKNAAKIADRVIGEAFPDTAQAADREGADRMLRLGVIARVSAILKGGSDIDQRDFVEIAPDFMHIVDRLHNHSHYVPLDDVQEYVHIGTLIANPEWLDAARKFKRQKGEETLAEADVLDELYHAVVRS
jgi:hypothetical protein